jgi:hypothetical protein
MMLASVFAMQAIGRLLAFGVSLGLIQRISKQKGLSPDAGDDPLAKLVVDQDWRWVVAVGLLPAFFAVTFRVSIPESR